MPVEFLTDEEAARFGRYSGPPSLPELDRLFFLDDDDKALIAKRRGDHMKLGFALQLVTVRYLGTFLTDPLDVPNVVVDYLAEQLGVADASCLKRYGERNQTRLEHAWEIQRALGFVEFAAAREELSSWVGARAWTTGDGPKAIFTDAAGWLRSRDVLLPGVSVLARLVARVRDETTSRLWDTLAEPLTAPQRLVLDDTLMVRDGARVGDLEQWRKGPTKTSGPSMVKALERISEIGGVGVSGLNLDVVPQRRLVELARYGLAGKTPLLKRHPAPRRHAILLATVRYLEDKATDDALELLDLLIAGELVGQAGRAADKQTLREHARLARASASLAAAVEVLLGGSAEQERVSVKELWEAIDAVVPLAVLQTAVATVGVLGGA